MNLLLNNNFETLELMELENLNGGLLILGVVISGALAFKIATGVDITVGTVKFLNWINV